jgi:hypothetical protein
MSRLGSLIRLRIKESIRLSKVEMEGEREREREREAESLARKEAITVLRPVFLRLINRSLRSVLLGRPTSLNMIRSKGPNVQVAQSPCMNRESLISRRSQSPDELAFVRSRGVHGGEEAQPCGERRLRGVLRPWQYSPTLGRLLHRRLALPQLRLRLAPRQLLHHALDTPRECEVRPTGNHVVGNFPPAAQTYIGSIESNLGIALESFLPFQVFFLPESQLALSFIRVIGAFIHTNLPAANSAETLRRIRRNENSASTSIMALLISVRADGLLLLGFQLRTYVSLIQFFIIVLAM